MCTGPERGAAISIEGQSWYGRAMTNLVVAPDVKSVTCDGKPILARNVYVGAKLRGKFGDFSVTRKKKVTRLVRRQRRPGWVAGCNHREGE